MRRHARCRRVLGHLIRVDGSRARSAQDGIWIGHEIAPCDSARGSRRDVRLLMGTGRGSASCGNHILENFRVDGVRGEEPKRPPRGHERKERLAPVQLFMNRESGRREPGVCSRGWRRTSVGHWCDLLPQKGHVGRRRVSSISGTTTPTMTQEKEAEGRAEGEGSEQARCDRVNREHGRHG